MPVNTKAQHSCTFTQASKLKAPKQQYNYMYLRFLCLTK